MKITACIVENAFFIGKVNVAAAIGVVLAILFVTIIIALLGCWMCKFKSKKRIISCKIS